MANIARGDNVLFRCSDNLKTSVAEQTTANREVFLFRTNQKSSRNIIIIEGIGSGLDIWYFNIFSNKLIS